VGPVFLEVISFLSEQGGAESLCLPAGSAAAGMMLDASLAEEQIILSVTADMPFSKKISALRCGLSE
jgi:hypothetical protein